MANSTVSFKNPDTFTEAFFNEHYDAFMEMFQNEDAHPECALENFYCEFIDGDDSLLTEEVKAKWVEDWLNDYGEDLGECSTFDEILEENDYLIEDLADWFIDNNPSCLEKWKPVLYKWITEMWNTDSINDAIETITED